MTVVDVLSLGLVGRSAGSAALAGSTVLAGDVTVLAGDVAIAIALVGAVELES